MQSDIEINITCKLVRIQMNVLAVEMLKRKLINVLKLLQLSEKLAGTNDILEMKYKRSNEDT